ncbi:MAG: glycosyltransferase family 39 protein [bacterium]|nr:glycosyltransferase family 39 protein [bacterium]
MNKLKRVFLRIHIPIDLLVIAGVSAYLRLYKISEYLTFLGDEGRDALVVKRMIVDHDLTLLGPTASVGGFFLGPIYYYFMLPFLWLSRLDPTGPAVMVALFGVATVILLYFVGSEFFGKTVGRIGSSLYALSPIVIAYSRSSWNPNVVPFFALVLIYLLLRSAKKPEKWEYIAIGITLGIGLQLHYLFLFLFGVTGVWLLLMGQYRKNLPHYALVLGGFLAGYSPFIAFEILHRFPNTQTIFRFLLEGKETGLVAGRFSVIVSDVVFRIFGRLVLRVPQPEIWNNLPATQLSLWIGATKILIYTSFISLIPGIIAYIRSRGKNKEIEETSRPYVLMAIWFLVVVVLFGFYKRGIYDYYFGILFPLPFLLTGIVFSHLFRSKLGAVFGVCLWGGLLYLNWLGRPFLYAPNNQLGQAKRIAEAAFRLTGGKPYNFALVTNFNSDHAYRYFLEIWGHPPVTIENEAIDPNRLTVTDQLIVICEIGDCKPLGHPLWEIAGFGRAQISDETTESFVRLFKLTHYLGEEEEVK